MKINALFLIFFILETVCNTGQCQTLSAKELADLIAKCKQEHGKVRSVQAYGTRLMSGSMFEPEEPQSKGSHLSATHRIFFCAMKGDKVRFSHIPEDAPAVSSQNRHELNLFTDSNAGNIYTAPGQFQSVNVGALGQAITTSKKVELGVSLRTLGFAVPDENKWPDELLQSGYHVIAVATDPKYGKLYECEGTWVENSSLRFWIAPDFSCRIVRAETRSKVVTTRYELNEVTQQQSIWLPKKATFTFEPTSGKPSSTDEWIIDKISINDIDDSIVTLYPKVGDQVHDIDTNQLYYIGSGGEKLFKNIPQGGTESALPYGWLFMASTSTLLVLTVGAYVRWKRKQLAERALSSSRRSA